MGFYDDDIEDEDYWDDDYFLRTQEEEEREREVKTEVKSETIIL